MLMDSEVESMTNTIFWRLAKFLPSNLKPNSEFQSFDEWKKMVLKRAPFELEEYEPISYFIKTVNETCCDQIESYYGYRRK